MKYFMTNTPLAGLERQMMTPPNFKPRGGGRMILNRFHYKPEKVEKLIRVRDGIHTEDENHKRRLSFWRSWLTQQSGKAIDHQPLAVLYLLTARESLWNKARPHLDSKKDNPCAGLSLRGIETRDYALLQTVKVICGESAGITIGDLADEEVVDDDTLRLIIDSALICRYGQAALFIGKGAAK